MCIRKATRHDLARIAEIEIFNYRLHFYPIFQNDDFYFADLTVPSQMDSLKSRLSNLWVYDDGVVKGFLEAENQEHPDVSHDALFLWF